MSAGGRSSCFFVRRRLGLAPSGQMFSFKEALLIRRLVFESTLSSLSGVKYRSAIIALSLRFSVFSQHSSF